MPVYPSCVDRVNVKAKSSPTLPVTSMRHSGQRNRGREPWSSAIARPLAAHIAVSSAGVMKSRSTCRSRGVFATNCSTPLMTTRFAIHVRLNVWKNSCPPGASTRAASATTRAGSSTCSRRSIAHTTSKLPSANGSVRASPTR